MKVLSVFGAALLLLVLVFIGSVKPHPYHGVVDGLHTYGYPGFMLIQIRDPGRPNHDKWVTRWHDGVLQTDYVAWFGRYSTVNRVPVKQETAQLMQQ